MKKTHNEIVTFIITTQAEAALHLIVELPKPKLYDYFLKDYISKVCYNFYCPVFFFPLCTHSYWAL